MEVEQDEDWSVFAGEFESEPAVHGRDDFDVGTASEDAFDEFEVGEVVFDVQDCVSSLRHGFVVFCRAVETFVTLDGPFDSRELE
jgi:hypothetical protein